METLPLSQRLINKRASGLDPKAFGPKQSDRRRGHQLDRQAGLQLMEEARFHAP